MYSHGFVRVAAAVPSVRMRSGLGRIVAASASLSPLLVVGARLLTE
jgi:hypothetical protein